MIGIKAASDALAAIFALGAAFCWFRAANAPLPVGSFPDWKDASAVKAALQSYQEFVQGAVWNKRAAMLAGVSAIATSASLLANILT